MRGFFIGVLVVGVLLAAGFVAVLVMAEGLAPETEEIRIEVTDDLVE